MSEANHKQQKWSKTLKTCIRKNWLALLSLFFVIILGSVAIAIAVKSYNLASSQNQRDEIRAKVEAFRIDVDIVGDTIADKQEREEKVDDLLTAHEQTQHLCGVATRAIAKGDYTEAKNATDEGVRILESIQPYASTISREDVEISITVSDVFLSFYVDLGNATGLTEDGNPLTTISLAVSDLPAPLGFYQTAVMSYWLSPYGATFDKPINITFYYGSGRVPEGFPEERLIILTWNSETGKWMTIPNVETGANSITMSVDRLTGYYVIVASLL